jgi:hypothetical protein
MTVPPGLTNVVAVAVGMNHSLAFRADGTVVSWGTYWDGTTDVPMTVPPGLTNVVSIASGADHSIALLGDGPPVVQASLRNPMVSAHGFSVSLSTQNGRVYALECKESLADTAWIPLPLIAGTGQERTLTDPMATGTRRFYRVRRW